MLGGGKNRKNDERTMRGGREGAKDREEMMSYVKAITEQKGVVDIKEYPDVTACHCSSTILQTPLYSPRRYEGVEELSLEKHREGQTDDNRNDDKM